MKLIALKCPNCGQPLTPEHDDVVVACVHCHTPVAISVNGPSKMSLTYALPDRGKVATSQWVPFWVFEGQVNILRRDTQGGSGSARKDSERLWAARRSLYVPAWDLSLHMAQEVGSRLIQEQPSFQFVDRPEESRLSSATVTPSEARKLLEFIVLAIEARRRDWLKSLEFDLDIGQPSLWALPQTPDLAY